MIRTLFFILIHLFWTGTVGILAILISPFDIHGRMIGRLTRVWASIILRASGIRYRITGLEQLDPDMHYFFVANHESAFDIPLAFAGLPYHLVSIAKKELKKIPILGWAMIRARHIFVDRRNHRSALKSLEKGAASLRKHPRSVLIFPEGTRSTDGQVHRFKRGGVGVALDLGIPVVPTAICGTGDILARRSLKIKRAEIELRLGAPIDTREWSEKSKGEFTDYLREKVVSLKESGTSDRKRHAQAVQV